MTDKEFIDRLNDKIINYGYIMLDRYEYHHYADRYKLKKYYKDYLYNGYWYFYRFQLVSINDNFRLGFDNIDEMLKFIEVEINNKYSVNWFSQEFKDFMMSIKGTSKEEICLKIQMMGY